MKLRIYHYDFHTGAYIGQGEADPDPMNEGGWLIPAFATPEQPAPSSAREWPFRCDEQWVNKPDFRGVALYRTADGTEASIDVPGVSPQEVGLTEKTRPGAEYIWRDGAWQLDEAAVAKLAKEAAMAEFEAKLANAREATLGLSDAMAAGLLDDVQSATFRVWAAYQQALVRELRNPRFPDVAWPPEPTERDIALAAEEMRKKRAAEEAERKRREDSMNVLDVGENTT
ncbi:phage tail fiber assembly protein [Burkholderia pseudomultivorans]|uniref:Phage tail fiber assembly protein n=1 Tax=Burkholderia pseudomultivorans TaxID=1207504 RepID=A0A6P2R309_9BURK|nr:tail fiber assembly protein [Burkholderia pseudomultivorans]VWC26524.1 phage tail fiber assembly protein [Burkholderia pseudomultivorans]